MIEIKVFEFIPEDLRNRARDALVDLAVEKAESHVNKDLARLIRQLRTDGAFIAEFEKGLQRAIQRFVDEYELQDEDLVQAILADRDLFKRASIQKALIKLLTHPGTLQEKELELLSQTFEDLLPERRNRQRVERAISYLLRCLVEELWHLPELQPIYTLQFQRLSVEAARQQVELQKAQLQALTELNSEVRDALLQLTDAIAEKKLLPSVLPSLLIETTNILHNLPQPDYGCFIGREDEIKQILRILQPYPHSQLHLVTIDGIGGVGKSALALEIAYRYLYNYENTPTDERFAAIIWTSAKKDILTAEGIKPRQQVLRVINDIYTVIGVTLQSSEITRANPEEQPEVVRKVLTQQRTLLIVDNLETIEDERIIAFLRELPAPTKAIVTTRHRIDVAYPVRLSGIPWIDAHQLISQECEKRLIKLNEKEQLLLYEKTGGLPLALIWSVAQTAYGYPIEAIVAQLSEANDITRFCFENAIELIKNKTAYKVLLSLSLFKHRADRNALKTICQISSVECDQSLVELEKLSLINRHENRYSMLPLTRSYVEQRLVSQPEIRRLLVHEFIRYFADLVRINIGSSYWEVLERWGHAYEIISLEINDVFEAAKYAADEDTPHFQDVCDIAMGTIHLLWSMGYFSIREQLMYLGIRAAHELGLEEQEAWFRVEGLGWVFWKRGEYDKCLSEMDTGKEIATRIGEPNILVMADILTALYYRDAKKEFSQAETLLLGLVDYPCNDKIKGYVYEELGALKESQGNYTEALDHIQKRIEIARKLKDKRDESLGLVKKGKINYYLGKLSESEESLKEALAIEKEFPDVAVAAEANFYLGRLAIDRCDKLMAEQYLGRSIKDFKHLGLNVQYEQAQQLLDQFLNERI